MGHNQNNFSLTFQKHQDPAHTPDNLPWNHKQDYWRECKDHLQRQMPDSLFQAMIEPLDARIDARIDTKIPAGSDAAQLELFAPSQQIAKRISQRYLPMIQDFLESTPLKGQVSLSVRQKENHLPKKQEQVEKEETSLAKVKTARQKKGAHAEKFASGLLLDEENFCIPEINQAQIEQLWQEKGAVSYIYGAEGSGKTTIAQALSRQKEKSGMRTRMLRFQVFVSELALVARNRESTNWNKGLRAYDCLLIDDFQYIKPQAFRSQEELSYLIDEFIQKNKLLVFCADRPVQKLPLTPSLLSRLQAGRIIQLAYPNQEERRKILKKRGSKAGPFLKDGAHPVFKLFYL